MTIIKPLTSQTPLLSNTPFLYFLKLTSPVKVFNLPFQLNNASKCKITTVKYKTNTANNDLLMIRINGFNENIFFDGEKNHRCVKIIPLSNEANHIIIYENHFTNDPDIEVNERPSNYGLTSLRVEALIDFNLSNDINDSNPLYIELKIW